ncbi:hypothetical protein cypCar_00021795 [Cyprinus carpio]|nr:hypothetical protein cypCar_00021795 [Cyprinus carpio]
MRKEMENLSQQMPIAQSQTVNPEPSTAGTTGYSQTLEKEILELKAKCCDFEERSMFYDCLNKNVCPVFKSEMVKQLQEENLSPRQQLLLLQSFIRGGTVGDVASLQSKLKQAALLISSLSQDKRQLIEMGNRLRAQLIEAELEG